MPLSEPLSVISSNDVWSGKHKHHGGNVQVVSAPDGWPPWTSDVRPGREHDMTCAHKHGVVDALTEVRDTLICLADLGYEGAADMLRVPIKKAPGQRLTDDQKTYNKLLRSVRSDRDLGGRRAYTVAGLADLDRVRRARWFHWPHCAGECRRRDSFSDARRSTCCGPRTFRDCGGRGLIRQELRERIVNGGE